MIQSLWIGDRLTNNELLCLRSFLHHGHAFHLYVYNEIPFLPSTVELKDANEIIPAAHLFRDERYSYASFADWFRLKLLYEKGGWWVDMDTVCLDTFDASGEYCFSSEVHYSREMNVLNNTYIKSPAGALLLGKLLSLVDQRMSAGGPMRWGEIGIELFRDVLPKYEEMKAWIRPPEVFCPLPYFNLSSLICKSNYVPDKHTKAIHLWNEMWRGGSLDKNATYHPDSVYERLKRKYLV